MLKNNLDNGGSGGRERFSSILFKFLIYKLSYLRLVRGNVYLFFVGNG